ncbi:amidase family protein [Streptomyces nigra]|uniref:amidase family protein n=1 Tax=Streptomyces nigra TaxID=1827580 RepID=UPI0036888FB4
MEHACRKVVAAAGAAALGTTVLLAAGPTASAKQARELTPGRVGTLTVRQVEQGLKAREFRCVDLVKAYLGRIAAYDKKGPALNAVIHTNPHALAQAKAIDTRLGKRGKSVGLRPAECLPVVVKDVVNTTDMPTTQGSEAFKDWVPEKNATIIETLESKGAIVLAKTNLDDFAAAVYGISSLTGAMRNPYDVTRTVGGSSGGSASAVAAGYAPLAFGTDTGGSLRIPAALTGVVTIRPTVGLVSRTGIFPRALSQDTAGPIAADVRSAAKGLDLVAGYDPADPVTARGVGHVPAAGYAAAAKGGRLDGMRIGLVAGGLAIWGDQPAGPVVALLKQAAADLEKRGATVVPLTGPDRTMLGDSSVITMESRRDVDAFLKAQGPGVPMASFKELYDSGAYTPYAKESYDREIQVDPAALSTNLAYQRSLTERLALQDWTLDTMAAHDLTAIAYPAAAQTADLIGKEQAGLFSRWSENTGFPAITVPMGYAASSTGTQMPADIEFLGRPFAESRIIGVASAYETATHKRRLPSLPAIP